MAKIYVLDSTVFVEADSSLFTDQACITVYEVSEEIRNSKASLDFDKMVQLGMQIIAPSEKSINKIKEIQKETNDKLSVTDTRLLALSLDFKNKNKDVVLVSDDYAIQNVCSILKIPFQTLEHKGIKETFEWERFCKSCGKKTTHKICEKCGSETVFVPKKLNTE